MAMLNFQYNFVCSILVTTCILLYMSQNVIGLPESKHRLKDKLQQNFQLEKHKDEKRVTSKDNRCKIFRENIKYIKNITQVLNDYIDIKYLITSECSEDSQCEPVQYCTNGVCTIPNPGN